jgi:hypothetical protein
MKIAEENLIDSLASASNNKRLLERRIVQLGLGVLSALQKGEMSFDNARQELFNVDNYLAIKRHQLSAHLIEFFQWGMELEDVAGLAPGGLGESYWRMNQIASRVMKHPTEKSRPRRSA